MSGPKKDSVPKDFSLLDLPSLHYINLLAGHRRKKWTYCETLIVYVYISVLSSKCSCWKSKKWFK